MKLNDLIVKGWLPTELPPPFSAVSFAEFYSTRKSLLPKVSGSSRGIKFTAPKIGLARRTFTVTNPVHQTFLNEQIIAHWLEIETAYAKSRLSYTKNFTSDERAFTLLPFKQYQEECFKQSSHHRFMVRSDVARFFPSIYTHSLAWAFHTKPWAKQNTSAKVAGNLLDTAVRNTQDKQTMGLPIGPDSSRILAEVIAIQIDVHLQEKFPKLIGYRFMDDMHYFFDDQTECELFFKELQIAAKEYELQINAEKTQIVAMPIGIENEWIINLRRYQFNKSRNEQKNDIVSYFSLAFNYKNQEQDSYILNYAVRKIHGAQIYPSNIDLLESMLLKTIVAEPSTMPDVLKVLMFYRKFIDLEKIKNTIQAILRHAAERAYDYEILWALWYSKTFKIVLDPEVASILNKVRDPLSVIMIIDLIRDSLIPAGVVDEMTLVGTITEDSLRDEKWMLVYELVRKGWGIAPRTLIEGSEKNKYFDVLLQNGVDFYDCNFQLDPKPKYKKRGYQFWKRYYEGDVDYEGY